MAIDRSDPFTPSLRDAIGEGVAMWKNRSFKFMFFAIAAALFSSAAPALPNSQIIFTKDGSKATITLLAFITNPDATLMYTTLSQPPTEMSGKETKHFEFKSDDGNPSFDVECV